MVNFFEQSFCNSEYDIRKITHFSHVMPVSALGNPDSAKIEKPLPEAFDGFKVMPPEAVNPETSEMRSLRRTKKVIRDKVFNNFDSKSRFLTLTYKGSGVFEKKVVQADIKAMVRRLEKAEGKDIKYIATLEEHKTGHGLHVHMLINCSYYKNEVFQSLFWQKGFVKLIRIKGEKTDCNIINVEKYLVKYLLKDARTQESHKARYLCSRNLSEKTKTTYGRKTIEQLEVFKKEALSQEWQKTSEYSIETENGITITSFILYKKRKKKEIDPFGYEILQIDENFSLALENLLTF